MLLAIVLGCLVGMVLYQMYYTQDRTYTLQSEISEMQQNLRVAIEKISRDLTMAGFAQPPWTTINGESGIDFEGMRVTGGTVLDVVGTFDGAQGTMAKKTVAGATALELSSGDGENFQGKGKIDINIGGRENAKITNKSGSTLTIDTDPHAVGLQGLHHEYPAGTPVYLVKWKTYWVDNAKPAEPVLRVDEHIGSGGQPLALFITGMAIAQTGRVASITISGKTRNPDRTTGLRTSGQLTNRIVLRNLP
ncbi:MAG TPA: hypothetical protein DCR97_11365 [Deltaproteobacteria bacterium]|nr:hypothetical protein [Deltaproteobacteria bacterium]